MGAWRLINIDYDNTTRPNGATIKAASTRCDAARRQFPPNNFN